VVELDKDNVDSKTTGRKLTIGYDFISARLFLSESSNIAILRCYSSVLMVYFRCLVVVFFVHVFDIPLDAAALSFVLRNDGEACQEFLILPTDKKEGEEKGEGKKKKIENC
jgi:hypothetical protein